jgi:hypothetical protein
MDKEVGHFPFASREVGKGKVLDLHEAGRGELLFCPTDHVLSFALWLSLSQPRDHPFIGMLRSCAYSGFHSDVWRIWRRNARPPREVEVDAIQLLGNRSSGRRDA